MQVGKIFREIPYRILFLGVDSYSEILFWQVTLIKNLLLLLPAPLLVGV